MNSDNTSKKKEYWKELRLRGINHLMNRLSNASKYYGVDERTLAKKLISEGLAALPEHIKDFRQPD